MHRRLLIALLPVTLLLAGAGSPGYERGEVTLRVNLDRSADVEVALSEASDAGVTTEPLLVPGIPLTDWRVLSPGAQASIQGSTPSDQGYGFRWLGTPEPHARLAFHLNDAVTYEGGHNQLDLSWMNHWQVPVSQWHTQVLFPPEHIPGAIWLDDDYSPGAVTFAWRGRLTESLRFGYWPLGERHNEQRLPQNLHYLLLWAGLTPSLYALARYEGRRPRRPLVPPTAVEVAFLQGSGSRALAVALLHLAARGAVQAKGDHWPGTLTEEEAEKLPPLPRWLYRLLGKSEISVQELLRGSVTQQDAAKLAHEELIVKGFVPSTADVGRLTSLRLAAIFGLLAMGVGIVAANHWEVHLSAGAWVTTVLGVIINLGWLLYGENRTHLTPDGRRWLAMNRDLANQRLRSADRSLLKDDAVQMDVAFFGPPALEGTSFAYLSESLSER